MGKLCGRLKLPVFSLLLLLLAFFSCGVNLGAVQTKPAPEPGQEATAGAGGPFSDVPADYWAAEVIKQLVDRKILAGYPDGTFGPENTLTRAEFAAVMTRAAGLAGQPSDKPAWQDVDPAEWYAPAVAAAGKYIGDFPGTGSGSGAGSGAGTGGGRLFRPAEPVLREQAAAALLKARGDGSQTPVNPGVLAAKFKDHGQIKAELRNMLAWAVEQGLVAGYADGTFRPQGTLTRAQGAALVARMFSQVEVSLKGFLEAGKLAPLGGTGQPYGKLVEKLAQEYPVIAVNQTPVKLRYYAEDLSPEPGSKEKILYVFVSIDPFKYFTFSDVDYKSKPDAVLEFNEAVLREISRIFPDKQTIVLMGYTNTLYYDPSGVYDASFIHYDEQERVWRIIRYYAGVRGKEGKTLEKWMSA